MRRIGIYAGTFNPVHVGHIAFALQAVELCKLNHLFFLPERKPRRKKQVEHFGHRVAMLRQATKPYAKFDVLEMDDVSFSVQRTFPKLQVMFPDTQLVFLFGSDTALHMYEWPLVDRLFKTAELVVGMRYGQTVTQVKQTIASWEHAPVVTLINSYAPDVSSTSVRAALQTRQSTKGLLKSVAKYSDHHWLYVSLT